MTYKDLKLDDIYDVAILRHGFTNYARDYQFYIAAYQWIGDLEGSYVLTFSHCYDLTYKTLVPDDVLKESWDDLFIDYKTWKKNNEPNGMVWGINWSLAFPGFKEVVNSDKAMDWSKRLDKPMKEVKLETTSFEISLTYENWKLEKISNEASTIRQVSL